MSRRKKSVDQPLPTAVYAYLRVSTDGQEEGNGLEVQRQHIAAYAAANGLAIDHWLLDVESGAKADRPALAELRRAVDGGTVGTILLYRIDRLARETELYLALQRKLGAKAKVVSVTEHFGEGFTGKLMQTIIAAFAEYERSLIAARLKGGRREAARKNGTYSGGIGVYGYRPVGTKSDPGKGVLKIVESEARAIRLAFKLRDAGKTLAQIAHRLNEEGYRTMRGAKFAPVHVHRLLAREAFYRGRGVVSRSVEAIKTIHPPILL